MQKPILLTLLFLFFSSTILAQTKPKIKEVGFVANTNGLGATYRFGHKESVWKIRLMVNDLSNERLGIGNTTFEFENFNVGIHFGKEWRKYLSNKLAFRYGLDLGFEYENNIETRTGAITDGIYKVDYSYPKTLMTGTVGFLYDVSDKLIFGIEALPRVGFSFDTYKYETANGPTRNSTTTHRRSFDLGVSLAFRF